MAFIADDLTKIEDAIRAHIEGKRIVSWTFSDRVERRSDTPLAELIKLRDQIKEELAAVQTDPTKRRPRLYRSRYSKGL